jgi:XTP/dITP diphosphohydrolase
MDLLLATHNEGKTREFAQTLGYEFQVRDLSDLKVAPIEETGTTFEENAIVKALAVSAYAPASLVVADDSGLEVDSLGGAPSIYSARYAGANATDQANVEKLLHELRVAGTSSDRRARFVCVLALMRSGELLNTFRGEVDGVIVDPPRGTGGFGYDPVFQPNGFAQTFAELAATLKNQISHRGRAIAQLRDYLRQI